MDETQKETLLEFFKATGQPERLRILGLIANQPYSVADLAARLHLKHTAVTRHLRALQKVNLVKQVGEWDTAVYQLNQSGLQKLNNIIDGSEQTASLAEQVLRKYVVNNRLQAIPQKAEERQIILAWLTDKFEPDRRYSEAEITDLMRNVTDQPLTLRRLLADNHFLLHTGRHYWRPIPGRQY